MCIDVSSTIQGTIASIDSAADVALIAACYAQEGCADGPDE